MEENCTPQVYDMDKNKLLSIFPAEVWSLILNSFNSPEDHKNCANSSPYFRELLKDGRVLYLFPEVIDILAVRNEPRAYEDVDEIRRRKVQLRNEPEDVPGSGLDESDYDDVHNAEDSENEWRSTMLNCRLVCSAWNKSVEKCYQQPKMNGISELVEEDDPASPLALMRDVTWSKVRLAGVIPWQTQKFLEDFEQTHFIGSVGTSPKNPFSGRFLTLIDYYGEDEAARLQWLANVRKILEHFGNEIWYLDLVLELDFDAYPNGLSRKNDEIYLKVKEWLELMPNLISIEITGMGVDEGDIAVGEEIVAGNPLPKLINLKVLRCDISEDLVRELVRRNEHISCLNLKPDPEQMLGNNIGKSLTNLKNLKTEVSDFDEYEKLEVGAHLKSFNGSKLEGIEVHNMRAYNLFEFLENTWANTLTYLFLDFQYPSFHEMRVKVSKEFRLNLPRIRKLHVRLGSPKFFFLDFALPLEKSLEHLTMEMYGKDRPSDDVIARMKKEQIVEFIGFEERIEESNIWKIFSKLKTFQLNGFDNDYDEGKLVRMYRVYTRAGKKTVYSPKRVPIV